MKFSRELKRLFFWFSTSQPIYSLKKACMTGSCHSSMSLVFYMHRSGLNLESLEKRTWKIRTWRLSKWHTSMLPNVKFECMISVSLLLCLAKCVGRGRGRGRSRGRGRGRQWWIFWPELLIYPPAPKSRECHFCPDFRGFLYDFRSRRRMSRCQA